MAYGLSVNNGNGNRVVDSENTGVYYVGKDSTSGVGPLTVPGYTNPDVPPLVFLKLPTGSEQFCSMTSLAFLAAGTTGGANTVSLTVPANIIMAFAPAQTELQCTNLGGVFHNDGQGGCRLNDSVQIVTDLSNTSRTATVEVNATDGVIDTGNTNVANAGFGWTVGATSTLDAPLQVERGWHPFNTATGQPQLENVLSITVNSLANGWVAQIQGSFTDTVTGYFYGIGGSEGASNTYGLTIKDSNGDTTFTTNQPPPVIRGIPNISFTGISYAASYLFAGDLPDGSSTNSNETLSFPTATTAMYSLPIMPTSWYGAGGQQTSSNLGNSFSGDYTAGLRFRTSGSNIIGLTQQSFAGATVLVNRSVCGTTNDIRQHSPFWTITLGAVTPVATTQTCGNSGQGTNTTSWNVNHNCIFIDTTIPDGLSY